MSFLSIWSFLITHILVIPYQVTTISYPGHFVPILGIAYPIQIAGWMDGWMDRRMDVWMGESLEVFVYFDLYFVVNNI